MKVSVYIHASLRVLFALMVISCPFSTIDLALRRIPRLRSVHHKRLNSIGSRDGPLRNALIDLSLTKDPDSTVFYVQHTYVQYICAFNSHSTGRRNIGRPRSQLLV